MTVVTDAIIAESIGVNGILVLDAHFNGKVNKGSLGKTDKFEYGEVKDEGCVDELVEDI